MKVNGDGMIECIYGIYYLVTVLFFIVLIEEYQALKDDDRLAYSLVDGRYG